MRVTALLVLSLKTQGAFTESIIANFSSSLSFFSSCCHFSLLCEIFSIFGFRLLTSLYHNAVDCRRSDDYLWGFREGKRVWIRQKGKIDSPLDLYLCSPLDRWSRMLRSFCLLVNFGLVCYWLWDLLYSRWLNRIELYLDRFTLLTWMIHSALIF